jgi:hypothetical protein
MSVKIVAKDDLQVFRLQLINDFKDLLKTHYNPSQEMSLERYKTHDVRKILKCSVNKLVSLRVSRKIRFKKLGGTVYNNREDVRRLLEEGF